MPFYRRQLVFAGLVLGLAACQPTPTLVPSSASGIGVGISDEECSSVIVEVGQQVTWTNQGSQEHLVRGESGDGKTQFESGVLKTGDYFTYTFLQPEVYTYECSADGDLTGTITVEP